MLATFIIIVLIIVLVLLWVTSTQRRLVVLEDNVSNAMSQIGVQLSSRFDALAALLDLIKGYTSQESDRLIEAVKSRRRTITAKSSPDDLAYQEEIIFEALARIVIIADQSPDLKTNKNYIKIMDAAETFENMIGTSRLIYNNSVTKLNSEIRMFPVSAIARMLGFRQKEYLMEKVDRADLPITL